MQVYRVTQQGYRHYRNNVPRGMGLSDRQVFMQIMDGFIKINIEKMLEGHEVELSSGNSLGTMMIVGNKVKPSFDADGNIKGLSTDWNKTKKLWESDPAAKERKQRVYHFNEHTNGVRYNFRWYKKDIVLANKDLYYLNTTKKLRRKFIKKLRDGGEFYNE